jgi:hypothetical protein
MLKPIPASALTSRSGLQIAFKTTSLSLGSERDCHFNLPRPVLRRMRAFRAVVLDESGIEIVRYAAVVCLIVRFTNVFFPVLSSIARLESSTNRTGDLAGDNPNR